MPRPMVVASVSTEIQSSASLASPRSTCQACSGSSGRTRPRSQQENQRSSRIGSWASASATGSSRALIRELRGVRAARLLPVAEALAHDPIRELRWFSCWLLARVLPDEPEQAWQVLRGLASEADDWISVDTLATTMGRGILAEPYRWAEVEQLVYSPSRWERRPVARSTNGIVAIVE